MPVFWERMDRYPLPKCNSSQQRSEYFNWTLWVRCLPRGGSWLVKPPLQTDDCVKRVEELPKWFNSILQGYSCSSSRRYCWRWYKKACGMSMMLWWGWSWPREDHEILMILDPINQNDEDDDDMWVPLLVHIKQLVPASSPIVCWGTPGGPGGPLM